MRRTVITRLQRGLLLITIALTCGFYHLVKDSTGWATWWGWVILAAGLILVEVILRSRTETRAEAHERRTERRRHRWLRNEARRAQADRDAWLREH